MDLTVEDAKPFLSAARLFPRLRQLALWLRDAQQVRWC